VRKLSKIDDKEHPEHAFMSLEKAKKICYTLAKVYGNTAIDIQGGEPTIYPHIFELIKYCNEIGLAPTLITNGIVLAKDEMCKKFKEAGVHDFLFSLHALGKDYDSIVGVDKGSERQMKALKNLQKNNIPFRFNLTMTSQAVEYMDEISQIAIDVGARAVNFITFNPFADQSSNNSTRTTSNVPIYEAVAKKLEINIDILEKNGIEVNVRYFPLCMLSEKYRKNIYDFQQLPYDPREWDYNSWSWTTRFNQKSNSSSLDKPVSLLLYNLPYYGNVDFANTQVHGKKEHDLIDVNLEEHFLKLFSCDLSKEDIYNQNGKLRAEKHCGYYKGDECKNCSISDICDGIHGDYAKIFGTKELNPVKNNEKIIDPTFYINNQNKLTDNDIRG
jgi:MoaA/NifB/PqqE/SkfB family radical SAM enzyme